MTPTILLAYARPMAIWGWHVAYAFAERFRFLDQVLRVYEHPYF